MLPVRLSSRSLGHCRQLPSGRNTGKHPSTQLRLAFHFQTIGIPGNAQTCNIRKQATIHFINLVFRVYGSRPFVVDGIGGNHAHLRAHDRSDLIMPLGLTAWGLVRPQLRHAGPNQTQAALSLSLSSSPLLVAVCLLLNSSFCRTLRVPLQHPVLPTPLPLT